MDGSIGRVRANLGFPPKTAQRIDPHGKHNEEREFADEFSSQEGKHPHPHRTKETKETPVAPTQERPVDHVIGSRLDVLG